MSFMLIIPVINLAKYQEMVCVKRLEDIVDKKKKNLKTNKAYTITTKIQKYTPNLEYTSSSITKPHKINFDVFNNPVKYNVFFGFWLPPRPKLSILEGFFF